MGYLPQFGVYVNPTCGTANCTVPLYKGEGWGRTPYICANLVRESSSPFPSIHVESEQPKHDPFSY